LTFDHAVNKLKGKKEEESEEKKLEELKRRNEKKKKLLKRALNFFSVNSAHIEVVREEKLDIVSFILLPYTHCLPKETKTFF